MEAITKENIFLDLSKLSEEQIKKIKDIIKYEIEEIEHYPLLIYLCDVWNQCKKNLNGRTELFYPEFIKLFEGGEGEKLYRPMTEFPPIPEGEQYSKMVLVFDEDLDDYDLGFYDFELQKWVVMGDFQMNLICWRHVEKPMYEDVQEYKTILTD